MPNSVLKAKFNFFHMHDNYYTGPFQIFTGGIELIFSANLHISINSFVSYD